MGIPWEWPYKPARCFLPTLPHAHRLDMRHQGICFDLQKARLLEQHNERGYDLNAGNLKPGWPGTHWILQASPRCSRLHPYGHIRAWPPPGVTHYDPTPLSTLRDFTKTHHPQIPMAYLIPWNIYFIMQVILSSLIFLKVTR